MVGDFAPLAEDGRDEQVFGAGIGGALVDEEGAPLRFGGGDGQLRLSDAGGPKETGCQRQIGIIDLDPACEELHQNFVLADPLAVCFVRVCEFETDAVNFHPPLR